MTKEMNQYAPYPDELEDIVDHLILTNKPEYTRFYLTDMERDHEGVHSGSAGGLTFVVWTEHKDAYHERPRPVSHLIPVPAATFNRAAWKRWVLDQLLAIELHELGEGFLLQDDDGGERPFAPTHGPGDNPYTLHEYATDKQRRTAFTGKMNDA